MPASAALTVEQAEQLSDAIHTLSQPLTTLSFLAEMALLQNSPEAWKTALQNCRGESRRAIDALAEVRRVVAAISGEDEAWEQ